MKCIWEANDIVPGRRYTRPGISEIWLIGYNYAEKIQYISISMSDGLVTVGVSAEDFAAQLTDGGYVPVEAVDLFNPAKTGRLATGSKA